MLTFTFDNLPAATADGTINITATGDIDAANETVALNVEGVVTATLFTTAGSSTQSAGVPVTLAQWNALMADGSVTVTLTPNSLVGSFTGNSATVTLNFDPGAVAGDMYRVTLAQDESLSAAIKARGTGTVTSLQLHDIDGATALATGAAAVNSDGAIVDFVADAAGDYFLRVQADGEYLLTATRAAAVELAPQPAMMGTVRECFLACSTDTRMISQCSSTLTVGDSPVVPQITTPFTPPLAWNSTWALRAP